MISNSKKTGWWRKVDFPRKIPFFISGLIAIHGLVEYSLLATLITRLTDDWAMILPMAVVTMNVYEGISSVLVIVVAELSECYFGYLYIIIFTNTTFILGLGTLLYLYTAEHLKVKALFGALALLSLSNAGGDITLRAFLADQLWSSKEDEQFHRKCGKMSWLFSRIARWKRGKKQDFEEDEATITIRRNFYWKVNWIFGIVLATLWLSKKMLKLILEISILAMIPGLVVFLLGIPSYECKNPSPSPILHVFEVVKAALSKRHLDNPVCSGQLFKNDTDCIQILPHIGFLRWLDKAAILEPPTPCPVSQGQEPARRLFEVAEVKEVKRLISMFPLWSTFYVYSLVDATANTFFYVQADDMAMNFEDISNAPTILVVIMASTSSIVSIISGFLKKKDQRRPPLNRIILGMFFSVLCCACAWGSEVYRRRYVKHISPFWLIPQFFCAGLMEGCCESGLQDFFETQVCDSLKGYGPQFSEFSTGIGKVLSVISILSCQSWLKKNINTSHLNKYYAMLLGPTILNFIFCCFVSNWYKDQPHDIETKDPTAQESEGGTA